MRGVFIIFDLLPSPSFLLVSLFILLLHGGDGAGVGQGQLRDSISDLLLYPAHQLIT